MTIYYASLNSGSNGNCYYVGSEQEAVLVDAGLSCRDTERRMDSLGLSLRKVKAIFISHEHTDHIKGVEVLSRKHDIPVYITPATHKNSRLRIDAGLVRDMFPHQEVYVGAFTIKPFPKHHDAVDPFSFAICGHGVNIGVMTDIGSACEHMVRHFRSCHAVFLEANYDEQMLEAGKYPPRLKARIRSDHGHLSNRQALQLFQSFRSPELSHLVLSHLSQHNNDPQLVHDLFSRHGGNIKISIASRYEPTGVFSVSKQD
jgi:phosphoribosyl 1,2-cyclic phosphodiesterase